MRYTNRKFTGQQIDLDGNQYVKCFFESCTLIYRGGKNTVIDSCSFSDFHIEFEDAAQNTLDLLQSLYHGGFKKVVEVTFNDIRSAPTRESKWILH